MMVQPTNMSKKKKKKILSSESSKARSAVDLVGFCLCAANKRQVEGFKWLKAAKGQERLWALDIEFGRFNF